MLIIALQLLAFVILVALGYWVINQLVPEPAKKYFIVLLVVVAVVIAVSWILSMAGGGAVFSLPRR